jgi:hypothetical protein
MRTLAPALLLAALLAALGAGSARAQVSGTVFEDRNADGLQQAGEPGLEGVTVRLLGTTGLGAPVDLSVLTGADGGFSFAPGDGTYLVEVEDPVGHRPTGPRSDSVAEGSPGFDFPVGLARHARPRQVIGALRGGSLDYMAMGDSIAYNFSLCSSQPNFWYSQQVADRLAAAVPSASVALEEAAVKGEHTDDLLVDDSAGDTNNVFDAMALQPDLVTVSIIGNDLLDVDPPSGAGQTEQNRAAAEIVDSRQNLQEFLATLSTEVPGADLVVHTLYDNLAWRCGTGDTTSFHVEWLPIINRIMRDLTFGQIRPASVAETAEEYAHLDLLDQCDGFEGLICRDFLGLDNIHPDGDGYQVHREKVWESVGGVQLGSAHPLGRTSAGDLRFGYLPRRLRLTGTATETLGGATALDPEAALDDEDGDAEARIQLGGGAGEFRVSGFPDWYDEVEVVRVLVGVRYRTTGVVGADTYRFEASRDGLFRPPPGHAYTSIDWDFFTPIVGGGGPSAPAENPDYAGARTLALPEVAALREVTATLTRNPEIAPGGDSLVWPPLSWEELGATEIRLAAAPEPGAPNSFGYEVHLESAYLEVYGNLKERPGEVSGLLVAKDGEGGLVFELDELAGAQRYNLYAGSLASLETGTLDHGGAVGGPFCDAATEPAGPGRRRLPLSAGEVPGGSLYFLLSAHVDEVESPTGYAHPGGAERDRSQSTCR